MLKIFSLGAPFDIISLITMATRAVADTTMPRTKNLLTFVETSNRDGFKLEILPKMYANFN